MQFFCASIDNVCLRNFFSGCRNAVANLALMLFLWGVFQVVSVTSGVRTGRWEKILSSVSEFEPDECRFFVSFRDGFPINERLEHWGHGWRRRASGSFQRMVRWEGEGWLLPTGNPRCGHCLWAGCHREWCCRGTQLSDTHYFFC